MENNEKLENDKFKKALGENKRLSKLVNEDIERFVENMMIIDRIKEELENLSKSVKKNLRVRISMISTI